jgi:hypothetical protein
MSALSKYGPLIRELGWLHDLLAVLAPLGSAADQQAQDTQRTQDITGKRKEPMAHELLAHLLKHCSPQVRVNQFSLTANIIIQDDNPWKPALHLVLPVVRHISVDTSFSGSHTQFFKLRNLLNQCSDGLEKLAFNINITHAEGEDKDEENQPDDDFKDWTSLRQLNLWALGDNPNAKTFWSWLWKRCGLVERLYVTVIREVDSLAKGMMKHMPHICEITLGRHLHGQVDFTDEEVAALLSGSRTGWRQVTIRRSAIFHRATMDVLVMHHSTLEKLDLDGTTNGASIDLVQLLRSGSRLRMVAHTDWQFTFQSGYPSTGTYPFIDAKAFIDRDPITGTLRRWECEASLESFTVSIAGIPRPDLGTPSILETYPGQGRDIQCQAHDRLARLTSLKELWLGHQYYRGSWTEEDEDEIHVDCLEMSLESGLHRLAGLKALETLSVSGMKTRIGLAEVQWMVEHWPKLRRIYGIDKGEDGRRAADWLREHHPKVHVGYLGG